MRILLILVLFICLLPFGLLGEGSAPGSTSLLQPTSHPREQMHTVVVEARLAGSGLYHEVVRGTGVPPVNFPSPGKWQVDIYIKVKWQVEIHLDKPKEDSVPWGHVEAQMFFYGKLVRFMPEIPCIKKNYLRMEQQSFHFSRIIDADPGGPELSFGVVAGGGGGPNGGAFSSYASIVAQVTYKLTPLEPGEQSMTPNIKEINEEAKKTINDHKEELAKRLGVQIPGNHGCVIGKIVWNPDRPCVGKPIYFAVQRSEKPVSVRWGFGDGTISNQEFTVHVYGEPGDYKVQAIIKGKDGSKYTRTVVLSIPLCEKPRPDPEKLKAYAKALAFHAKNLSYQQYLLLKNRYYKIHWATETAKAIADTVFGLLGRPPKPETVRKLIWPSTKFTILGAAAIGAAATHKPSLEWLDKLWENALKLQEKVRFIIAKKKTNFVLSSLRDFVYALSDHYDAQALDAINALADQANLLPIIDPMDCPCLQTPSLVSLDDKTSFSVIERAAVDITNCQSWQNAIDEIFVDLFEQYQSAVIAGDDASIKAHAMCLRKYALRALDNLSTLLESIDVAAEWIVGHEDTISQHFQEAREQLAPQIKEEILSKLSTDQATTLATFICTTDVEKMLQDLQALRVSSEEKKEMYTDFFRHTSWIASDLVMNTLHPASPAINHLRDLR